MKITIQNSTIHGKGVFALTKFQKDNLIGIYEGKKVSEDGTYVLWIWENDQLLYGIDGE